MTREVRDKRFAVIAIEKGFIPKEVLFEALQVQGEEDLLGVFHSLVGLILITPGYLKHEQADESLIAMGRK